MEVNVNIKGIVEATKRFKVGIPSAKINQAVFESGNYFRSQALQNVQQSVYSRSVPWRRTGKLQQSIILGPGTDTRKVSVGVDYAKFVEFGTKPHTITPKKGKFISFTSSGQRVFARKINHPGSKAYPFWRPAIKSTKSQVPFILKKILSELT